MSLGHFQNYNPLKPGDFRRYGVEDELDTNQYETGVTISDEKIDQLRLKRHKLHPDWNYTLLPRT